MDKIRIPTSFNIELEFELADVARRFLGWLIDFAIQGAYLLIAFEVFGSLIISKNIDNDMPAMYNLSAVALMLYVPILVYHFLSELLLNGQSIGKKIVGIKVISESGNRPSIYQFMLRWLIRPFDFYLFMLPAFITAVATKKKPAPWRSCRWYTCYKKPGKKQYRRHHFS